MILRRKRAGGFSLVESALSLAVIAFAGVALVGILGTGLNVAREALDDADTSLLIENVQSRLNIDPDWPGKRLTRHYDHSGAETTLESSASYRTIFKKISGPGFSSNYFETFRVEITRLPEDKAAAVWMLQRARLSDGRPVAATEK
jgi:type II secretory pathway pseudopilin PulG